MRPRSLQTALARGAKGKCPQCGKGGMFDGFLGISHTCSHCGQELHHHRADDAPPYVVMFIVGHVVVALMLWWEQTAPPPLWLHGAVFLPLTVVLCLALLRPVKGALVGYQWANRMHGFAPQGAGAP